MTVRRARLSAPGSAATKTCGLCSRHDAGRAAHRATAWHVRPSFRASSAAERWDNAASLIVLVEGARLIMDAAYGLLVVLVLLLLVAGRLFTRVVADWAGGRHYPRVRLSVLCKLPEEPGRAETLKTGDLILYVAYSNGVSSLFIPDMFSHGGMVVEDGKGRLYCSESTVACGVMPDPEDPGRALAAPERATAYPLLARLKYYSGTCFALRLNRPLDPARRKTICRLAFDPPPGPAPYPGFLQGIGGLLGLQSFKARHCMEHIGWLLDCAGLTPVELGRRGKTLWRAGFLGSTREVCKLAGAQPRELPDGYCYREPVQVLYDLDAI